MIIAGVRGVSNANDGPLGYRGHRWRKGGGVVRADSGGITANAAASSRVPGAFP